MQLQVLACCFFINPATSGVFHDCPACGGMSGTYSLLHRDVASAIDHNALLLGFYPLVLLRLSAFGFCELGIEGVTLCVKLG